jgi:hypothetical protein
VGTQIRREPAAPDRTPPAPKGERLAFRLWRPPRKAGLPHSGVSEHAGVTAVHLTRSVSCLPDGIPNPRGGRSASKLAPPTLRRGQGIPEMVPVRDEGAFPPCRRWNRRSERRHHAPPGRAPGRGLRLGAEDRGVRRRVAVGATAGVRDLRDGRLYFPRHGDFRLSAPETEFLCPVRVRGL